MLRMRLHLGLIGILPSGSIQLLLKLRAGFYRTFARARTAAGSPAEGCKAHAYETEVD
jgi:hypothetical protein